MDCGLGETACAIALTGAAMWSLLQGLGALAWANCLVYWAWIQPHISNIAGVGGFAFGVWKWWHTREAALYRRLSEMLAKEDRRLRAAREDVLSAISFSAPGQTVKQPLFVVGALGRILSKRHWVPVIRLTSPLTVADRALQRSLGQLDRQQEFADKLMAFYRQQRYSALLLQGAVASERAAQAVATERVAHFAGAATWSLKQAVELSADDFDALEMLGRQRLLGGQIEQAKDDFDLLFVKSQQYQDPRTKAFLALRAKRLRMEIALDVVPLNVWTEMTARLVDFKRFERSRDATMRLRELLVEAQAAELKALAGSRLPQFVRAAPAATETALECYERLIMHGNSSTRSTRNWLGFKFNRRFVTEGNQRLQTLAAEGGARCKLLLENQKLVAAQDARGPVVDVKLEEPTGAP